MHRTNKKQTLKLMHQNIHGYGGKEDEIQEFLEKSDVDVLCLTEHWQDDAQSGFHFRDYEVASSFCRQNKTRGGSAIVVKAGLVGQIENTCSKAIENMSQEEIIELSCVELRNQIYICAYTPSVSVYNEFEPVMKNALKVAAASGKSVTVCGDFNVDLLRNSSKRTKIIKMFSDAGLRYLFEEPTRVTRTTATCIDNVFSNCDYKDKRIINTLKSDHSGQIVTFDVAGDEINHDLNNNDVNLKAVIETCGQCERTFTSKAGYLSHMRSHERQKTGSAQASGLKCSLCDLTLASGAGLASHMRAHERKNAESADTSPRNADVPVKASVSSQKNDNSSGFSCTQCGQTCASGAGLASHMRAHERKNDESVDTSPRNADVPVKATVSSLKNVNSSGFSCAQCGQTCASSAGLASHMRAHERKKAEYVDTSPRNADVPVKASVSSQKNDNSSGFSCAQCGQTCASSAGLASHMKAHERKKTEYVETSSRSADVPIKASVPSQKYDNSSGFSCAQCGQTCASGAGLASHMRAHERKNDEAVDTSPRNADVPVKATVSSQKNVNSSGFSCAQCGQTCASSAGLASHMRAHERKKAEYVETSSRSAEVPIRASISSQNNYNIPAYSCDQCGQTCATGAGLASHMRAHERKKAEYVETSSRCADVPIRASVSSQNNYNIPAYSCDQCGQTCATGAGLASHMRAHERKKAEYVETSSRSADVPIRASVSTQNNYNIPVFSCGQCGQTCATGAGLASHMRAHERKKAEYVETSSRSADVPIRASVSTQNNYNIPVFSCGQCGQTCASGAGLASHMRAHERRNAEYFQPQQSYNYSNSSSNGSYYYQAPSRSSYSPQNNYNSSGYSCGQCGQICASGAGLASHMRAHARRH